MCTVSVSILCRAKIFRAWPMATPMASAMSRWQQTMHWKATAWRAMGAYSQTSSPIDMEVTSPALSRQRCIAWAVRVSHCPIMSLPCGRPEYIQQLRAMHTVSEIFAEFSLRLQNSWS